MAPGWPRRLSDPLAVAIDGPVASGKSVVGRLLAERLGVRFLDTGTMYRAVTHEALRRNFDMEDHQALTRLAEEIEFGLVLAGGEYRLAVDGREVTQNMRELEVEKGVSLVAAVRGVRRALVAQQQTIADQVRIVMAGRDIGTVVLPGAAPKVFLTASVESRARRRHREGAHDEPGSYERVVESVVRRDRLDSERVESPLRQADDAVRIDTDRLEIHEVVDRVLELIRGA